jgi:hypothetical protein
MSSPPLSPPLCLSHRINAPHSPSANISWEAIIVQPNISSLASIIIVTSHTINTHHIGDYLKYQL